MKRPSSTPKFSRAVKWTTGIGIALAVYTLAGVFLLPAIIKWQILRRLPATVQQVKVNPFVLSLTIRGLTLKDTNGDVSSSCDELYLNFRLASIFKRIFMLQEINLSKPVGSVILRQDGRSSLAGLSGISPRAVVERLCVAEGALAVADSNGTPVVKLSRISLTLTGLSDQTNAPVSATLTMLCNETGTVALQGTVFPVARSADVQVQLNNLDLRAIQPYVAEIWKLEITDGALTATGRVLVAAAGSGAPLVQFVGELGVAKFASVDMEAHEELLKLDSLTLTGLDLRYLPHGVDVAAVGLVGLRGNVFIRSDKSSNLKGMLKDAQKLRDLIVKLQLNKLFPFKIGPVNFADGSFGFADRSIKPNVAVEIRDVAGTVAGLSSDKDATMTVDLHGKLEGDSPLKISGTMKPLADDLVLDLTLALENGEMPPGSPYAGKYIGYPIHRGQLSIEAHYAVDQRTLKAENKFIAHRLRLGARSDSPDAIQLNVKLAIALLQDRDGSLTFNVPVSGNLDNPQFQFGPVVAQVFVSMITKAVSNPFALLGSPVGDGEPMDFVNFKPGSSDFATGQTQKLDALAKALGAHPALELEITGSVDTTSDRIGLAAIKLHEVKAGRTKEIVVAVPPADATQPKQNFGPLTPSDGPAKVLPRYSLPVEQAYANLRLSETEEAIIETIEVTPNDYRALMQARAEKVQQYLVQTGQVTADRLFIVAPAPVDSSYQGQSRVDLSLQ